MKLFLDENFGDYLHVVEVSGDVQGNKISRSYCGLTRAGESVFTLEPVSIKPDALRKALDAAGYIGLRICFTCLERVPGYLQARQEAYSR